MGGALYLSHESSLAHDPSGIAPGHPDTPERMRVLEAALAEREWFGFERRSSPAASIEQLELAHSPQLVEQIRAVSREGGAMLDPDTYVMEASWDAALHAASGALELTRALLAGEASAGFSAHRPSGHHAGRGRAMGFCLLNNVAVAAAWAIAELGLERVLVLDWDVHHGNGTAEIFRERSDVLFASLHQYPLYPGTGPLSDAGIGGGEGHTINLPVPPGTGEGLWMELFERIVLAAGRQFEPQLILVSAGFDAHADDPLASCRLRTSSFPLMASLVRELALELGAPLGVVMEGGYNVRVLADSVCAMLPALSGELEQEPPRERLEQDRPEPLLEAALAQYGRWWRLR